MIINYGTMAINLPCIDKPDLASPFYKWVMLNTGYSDLSKNYSCRTLAIGNDFITLYSFGKIIRIKNWQTDSPIYETIANIISNPVINPAPSPDYYRSDNNYNAFCVGGITSATGVYNFINFKISRKDGSYTAINNLTFTLLKRGLGNVARDKNGNWFFNNSYGSAAFMIHKVSSTGTVSMGYSSGNVIGAPKGQTGCTTTDGYALFMGRTYSNKAPCVIYETNEGEINTAIGSSDSGNSFGGGMGRISNNSYWYGYMSELVATRSESGTITLDYQTANSSYKDIVAKFGTNLLFNKAYSSKVSGDSKYIFYYTDKNGDETTLQISPPSGTTITYTLIQHDNFTIDEYGYGATVIYLTSGLIALCVINHKALTEN